MEFIRRVCFVIYFAIFLIFSARSATLNGPRTDSTFYVSVNVISIKGNDTIEYCKDGACRISRNDTLENYLLKVMYYNKSGLVELDSIRAKLWFILGGFRREYLINSKEVGSTINNFKKFMTSKFEIYFVIDSIKFKDKWISDVGIIGEKYIVFYCTSKETYFYKKFDNLTDAIKQTNIAKTYSWWFYNNNLQPILIINCE